MALTVGQQAAALNLLMRWANLAEARKLKLGAGEGKEVMLGKLAAEEDHLLRETQKLIGGGDSGGAAVSFGWLS